MKTWIISEEKLVERCLKRDRKAEESLYERYYAELYRIGMRYLSDHQDTEDVAIQSFTKVYQNLKSFQYYGKGSLGKWIRTIMINESLKFLQRRKNIAFEEDLGVVETESDNWNALQHMEAEDVLRMIEALPNGYRIVFNLYIIEGYSHQEIAEMLNISENTSKSQLRKARLTLIQALKAEKSYGKQGF